MLQTTRIRTGSVSCVSLVLHRNARLFPRQVYDVAEGLNFLHSCNVVHGDLNGVCDCSGSRITTVLTSTQSNVLVTATGRARITDFGLVMATQNPDSVWSAPPEYGPSARWIAPEILCDFGTYSKEGDVFSFAMITFGVRRGLSTRCRYLAEYSSFSQRRLLARSRSMTIHLTRLRWQLWMVNVHHARPTQLLWTGYGH